MVHSVCCPCPDCEDLRACKRKELMIKKAEARA